MDEDHPDRFVRPIWVLKISDDCVQRHAKHFVAVVNVADHFVFAKAFEVQTRSVLIHFSSGLRPLLLGLKRHVESLVFSWCQGFLRGWHSNRK